MSFDFSVYAIKKKVHRKQERKSQEVIAICQPAASCVQRLRFAAGWVAPVSHTNPAPHPTRFFLSSLWNPFPLFSVKATGGGGCGEWTESVKASHTQTTQCWTSHPLESVYLFPVLYYWTPSRDLKYLISSKTRVSRCPIRYVVLMVLSGGTDLPVEIHVMCWSTSSKPALASLTHLQPITGDPALLNCWNGKFTIISSEMSHNSTRAPVASHYHNSSLLRCTFFHCSGGDGVMRSLNNQTFGLVWPLDSFLTHLQRSWRHL